MEYLGSKYDDKFEIQILDENNQILYNNIHESVNESAVVIDNIKIY